MTLSAFPKGCAKLRVRDMEYIKITYFLTGYAEQTYDHLITNNYQRVISPIKAIKHLETTKLRKPTSNCIL